MRDRALDKETYTHRKRERDNSGVIVEIPIFFCTCVVRRFVDFFISHLILSVGEKTAAAAVVVEGD